MARKQKTGQDGHSTRPRGVVAQPRLPGPQRRTAIMHHALQCFSTSGYHLTSMDDIAREAGITKPIIYRHFPSKRQLYADLIRTAGEELCNRIRVATERAKTPHQRVALGFEAYFRFACESRAGYELLFGSGPRRDPEFRDAIVQIETEIADLVTSKIEADIDETERRFVALGVISLAEGTVRRWLSTLDPRTYPHFASVPFEETDAAAWSHRMTNLAWAGLRGVRRDTELTR